MVTIPVYEDLSLSLVGSALGGDVQITGIRLAALSLSPSQPLTFSNKFLSNSGGDRYTFRPADEVLNKVLEFPARTFQLSGIGVAIAWTSLRLRIVLRNTDEQSSITLEIHDLRLSTSLIPGFSLSGHLKLSVSLDQVLSLADSLFNRLESATSEALPLELLGLRLTEDYFAIRWKETRINYWLRGLVPNVFDQSAQIESTATLRVLFGRPIPEIRLDWDASGVSKTFSLPGMKLVTPDQVMFTLLLQSSEESEQLNHLAMILTLPEKAKITAYSNFSWEREGDRELQPPSDENREAEDADAPFLQLDAMPGQPVSLVLLQIRLDQGGLPRFFQQLAAPISELSFERSESQSLARKTVSSFEDFVALQRDVWGANNLSAEPITPDDLEDITPEAALEPGLTVTLNPFTLPFLNRPEDTRQDSSGNDQVPKQRIRINNNGRPFRAHADFATHELSMPLELGVLIGDLEFNTSINLKLNWSTFAFRVEHSGGIRLLSDEEFLPEKQFLGLTWRFQGGKLPDDNRFHHLTLVTENYDYKIIQGDGAVIEVDYTRASDDPITFALSNLAISAKGLSITAEVTDRPARLNGVDTRFRFHGSRLSIVDNRVQDFTLAGSGPLPPALVGEAMVNISLQFAQRNGNLTLVEGGARIGGDKLLNCQGTRFQFSVDSIGLKFVNDDKFHLYFTISGSAQYRLAPGDSTDGPLALLSAVKIELVDCPLTGDASVVARHVNFLIDLPKPVSFSLLGCFEMEIRGFGFVPQFDKFDGAPAMRIAGQVKFAQGKGDAISARIDVHDLYIGLPRPGTFIPRLYLRELTVEITAGKAFKLYGVVEFIDEADATGFAGEGRLEIKGLPVIAASFAFLRVRRNENAPWVRAWFIFLQIEQVTFRIPYVELYIREVGLGFGYRYTIASIRAADQSGSLRELLQELRKLSRTQGDLTRRDRWAVDLEDEGEALRWTIVLRALISQTSASPNSLKWIEAAERVLPCLYVMDAIIVFRSDLTFFMAVRCWFNTNYWGFVNDVDGLRERPLLSGFVLLSVRQKRFIAQISSNPDGSLGHLIPIPPMVERIVNNGQFSATLLIEPGLFHAELGWPNMLRWSTKVGPLEVDIRGGAIFRTTADNLVVGVSFYARGGFRFEAEKNLRIFGARVSADVHAAFGARYIGLIDFNDPAAGSAFYAAIGLEVRIRVAIEFWIKFIFVTKRFRFSFSLEFTAAAELGLAGVNPDGAGFRAHGTLSVRLMGRGIQLSVRIGFREHNILAARSRTEPFLTVGLEATDVEAVPGVEAAEPARVAASPSVARTAEVSPASPASRSATPLAGGGGSSSLPTALDAQPEAFVSQPEASELSAEADPEADPEAIAAAEAEAASEALQAFRASRSFSLPNYDVFWIEAPDGAGVSDGSDGSAVSTDMSTESDTPQYGYFVLIPRAEPPVGSQDLEERGFLPAPPLGSVVADFAMELPDLPMLSLEQYDPDAMEWRSRSAGESFAWRANWDAVVISGTRFDPATEEPSLDDAGATMQGTQTLQDYLAFAFIVNDDDLDKAVPLGDPDPLSDRDHDQRVTDERVHHPTEDSYESAVRGALEQFRASPFFKRDPNSDYDQALEAAFQPNTTVYNDSGETDAIADLNQQAHQLRGLVVQDMVSDLRDYAAGTATDTSAMIGFQMGLVFRYQGEPPQWLTDAAPVTHAGDPAENGWPKIYQRLGPDQKEPDRDQARQVRTFNVASTNFESNPPQFQRVEQFTDANTIALAWDLVWPDRPDQACTDCQAEPEQHLVHYHVQRRSLDGSDREAVYTVKGAEVLHYDGSSGILKHLQPRFQVVDHFNAETLDDQANLPITGRSYIYTITPVDMAGHRGRPLTLVATRYPNEPPQVPVNAQLQVRYTLERADQTVVVTTPGQSDQPLLDAIAPQRPVAPNLLRPVLPDASRDSDADSANDLGIVITWQDPSPLRDAPLVPIAIYRLIFRRETLLPIGSYGLDNSIQGPRTKTLPTSNARPLPTDIRLELTPRGPQNRRQARISLAELQAKGIFPTGNDPQWEPLSWRVYLQTESANGVPSALAPVELLLRVETPDGAEERQPSELEWIPKPLRLPVLPPEDMRATTGTAHVPMPPTLPLTPSIDLSTAIGFTQHPAHLQLVRFRWNQGPSDQRDYPLDLNAGYDLLQLDVDANTDAVLRGDDTEQFAQALKPVQDVQMLPADDLLLTPEDTLNPSAWEAWYPSMVLRRRTAAARAQQRSEIEQGPWYSWRESRLLWPEWEGLTNPERTQAEALHPLLTEILKQLQTSHTLDVQTSPPMQPVDLPGFLESTAPKADPYGWGILQRLGLTVGLSLRSLSTNNLLAGDDLVAALRSVLEPLQADPAWESYFPHLYLELLVQPSRSIQPEDTATLDLDGLLAIAQLSLRPRIQQVQRYGWLTLRGQAGTTVPLRLTLTAPCSVIDQADGDRGQIELETSAQPVLLSLVLPLTGETTLLIRSETLPDIQLDETQLAANQPRPTLGSLTTFLPTDERSTYFTVAMEELGAQFADGDSLEGKEWRRLRDYLEFLNPDQQSGPDRILVPVDDAQAIAAILPDVLVWMQRFFDASGAVTTDPEALNSIATGPWLATAYPQTGTPAYASPDSSGRLRYDHLIESRWAHSYRYYIRPYSRYELLWQGLLQSPVLFPDVRPDVEAVMAELVPDPQIGGLDVVLDRTQPVDAPLILSSARLDAPSTPGAPAQPGSIWEVLLAQHPEQLLSERNQTLARQLDFRGVAVTLMRRFAYDDWPNKLVDASLNHPKLIVQNVEAVYPELPEAYPSQPDHLDLTQPLDAEAARSLDLPQRIGNFQQGAMALQWEALPYFYEHRLMAIAQTSTQVSESNNTIQQDFEYQSPMPEALVDAITVAWRPEGSDHDIQVRSRQITIPLQRFWDCMPPEAQKRWDSEAPLPKTTPGETDATDLVRKPASLPDFDVVYQIIERFSGNIEVQADYVFDDREGDPRYIHRQLGRRFLANVQHLQPPSLSRPHGDYLLETTLQQVSETDLLRDNFTGLRSPTVHKITYKDHHLTVVGTLTQEDFHNLLLAMIRDNLRPADLRDRDQDLTPAQVIDTWFSTHPVNAHSLADLPAGLLAKVHYPDLPYRPELASGLDLPVELQGQLFLRSDLPGRSPENQRLQVIWRGALSTVQRQQLLDYHKDLNGFHQRLRSIIQKVEQFTASASYAVPIRPRPDSNLPGSLAIRVTYPPADRPGWVLQWRNNISPQDQMALRRLPGDAPFRSAINRLINRINETYSLSSSVTSTDVSPALDPEPTAPSDLPLTIASQTGQNFARYRLTWTGPIRSDQAQRLRTELPTDLLESVNELITQIQAAMEDVTEDRDTQSLLFREAIADDEFVWPRIDKAQLASQMQANLSALTIGSNQITWQGLVNPSPENLVIRLRRLLRQADPFLAAFTQLMDDISAAVFTEGLGEQRFRVRELLTAAERDRLTERMGNQAGLTNLFRDWDDRQSLDELYQSGFSQVPISAKPERVNRLAGPIDFPEVENLVLVRTDRLTETEAIALLNLPGDPDFKAALRQLIRPQQFDNLPELRIDSEQGTLTWLGARPTATQQERLRELKGDAAFQQALGRLVNAIAATADANLDLSVPMEPEPDYATAIAPQGLDQVPQAIASQVSIAVNNQRVQTDLIWTGPLTDAAVTTLQDWAQISAMMTAVQALISERDRERIVVSLPSDRPSELRNVLHIHPGELVWTGGLPSDDQRAALTQLQANSDHNPPLQTALGRLLSTPDAQFPVVAIAAPQLQPRPRLDQRPDILRADDLVRRFMPNSPPNNLSEAQVAALLAHQLVIQPTSLVWLGRVHHLDQLQALQNLPGDPAFREAIAQLHAQLSTKVSTIALETRLPQRPQQDELPAGLRDKLLLGRAQLRYHGLMTLDEGRQIRRQVTTQPDQASIQRLYDQSMDTGLRGNELLIRARRGNARPSDMYPLKPRSL